ncbi:ATP-binding protein [Photobacterium phosphoreum]|uniref:ATP-binding protein n=1 Tax=Photobacterium phosphoreum TaxID=659 RepID=UPI000A7645F3|nr:HAMP domain-containing sensor histidine kinase [Photobacterium phosphoreum]
MHKKKYNNSDAEINKIINRYTGLIENTLNNVHDFWIKESRLDKKSYNHQALPILDEITDSSDTEQVLNTLDIIYNNLSEDVTYKYEAFLKALDKLEKGIDIDSAFVIAEEERSKAEWEINNLRRLAQLGISFEIVSHEIKAQEEAVTKALNSMNSEAKNHIGFKNAMRAHRQFIEYLRFLSPLKLSGYQSRDEITGTEISKYIHQFFSERAERQNISIEISNNFKRMVIVDVSSRIHPVFINIINNAMYWVGLSEVREIKIDVIDDLVVIANTGPEVDQDDIERLFELFYTRRSDGNGVGLYLSKQNLSVAHHKIWYALKSEEKLIKNGANFIIKFRGMELK